MAEKKKTGGSRNSGAASKKTQNSKKTAPDGSDASKAPVTAVKKAPEAADSNIPEVVMVDTPAPLTEVITVPENPPEQDITVELPFYSSSPDIEPVTTPAPLTEVITVQEDAPEEEITVELPFHSAGPHIEPLPSASRAELTAPEPSSILMPVSNDAERAALKAELRRELAEIRSMLPRWPFILNNK